jgi:hypothetical protein
LPPSIPNPPPLAHRQSSETSPRSDTSAKPSPLDLLVTPSLSYSSSSSAHESASPPTPSESFSELHLRDKSRPPLVPDSPHTTENGQTNLYSAIHSLLRPNQQNLDASEAPRSFKRGSAPAGDPLGIARTKSQSSGTVPSGPLRRSQPPSPSSPGPRLGVDDAGSVRSSCHSTATSDAGAGIGLSMLQDFLPGNVDDAEDEEDEGGEDSDHETSSQSERGRTSLEETVDGFPAPPTQIPTPSSQATSFILDPRRPISSASEDSEDGDGASLYDNYRYSRLSVSSKMSKSSGYTVATIPPPIPTEPPPPVRSHSQDSHSSAQAPPSEPPSPSLSEPSSSVSSSPRETTPPTTATQATIRTIPPPLTLKNSRIDLEPSNSSLATATATSPLLHANFGAPQSPPRNPNSPTKWSPIGAAFDLRGRGSALALRQKVEQPVVEDGNERDVPPGIRRSSPQSPTLLAAAAGSSIARTALEKKKRDGPPPLVVMNPTPPPPPYTPKPPQASSTPLSPTLTALPTPITPHIPSRAGAIAEPTTTDAPQPLTTTTAAAAAAAAAATTTTTTTGNLFLPHPNAPKPNTSPQAPLYGRTMPSAVPLHSTLLIQAMRRAAQMRVAPNGLPRFSTIYGTTAQDLALAAGPVLIYFSLDPPNDVPANRMRAAPIAVAVTAPPPPPPPPVPISNQNPLSPAPGAQQPLPGQPSRRQGVGATTDSIPRAGFVPKAGAVRPRSRSFSGFDSALAPETQPKEQRYVLHSISPILVFSLLIEELFTAEVRRRTHVHRRRIRHLAPAPASIDWLRGLLYIPLAFTSHDNIPRRHCPCPNRQIDPIHRLWQPAFLHHHRAILSHPRRPQLYVVG